MRGLGPGACAVTCVLLLVATSVARAPTLADEYEMHWRAATNALVTFSTAEMVASEGASENLRQPAQTFRRELDNFARDLAWISQSKPEPSQFVRHWELVPIYEQILSAMTIVTQAAETNDSAAGAAGWASFRDALTHLRRTIEEVTRAHE